MIQLKYSHIKIIPKYSVFHHVQHVEQSYLLVGQLLLMPVVLYTGELLEQHRRVHL